MKKKIGNIEINFEYAERKGRPVVMLSHSLGCNLHMWDPQVEVLKSRFSVLRYDTRGHGESSGPERDYTFEQLSEDALRLADALGIESFHWVGLSMGGMIGQGIALTHPDRLKSLILSDTCAYMPEEAQPIWQWRIDTAREKGLPALLQSTLEDWFTPGFLAQDPPLVKMISDQFVTTTLAGYIGCIGAIRRLNYLDRLSTVKVPTHLIVGEQDFGTPVAASKAIQGKISGARLNVIPSAAHLSCIEQPQAFQKVLMASLP